MKRAALLIALLWVAGNCAYPIVNQSGTDISSYTAYTLKAPPARILVKMGIWPYFQQNNITTGAPFPDNGILQAYGLDPGNCVVQFIPPNNFICTNYRFLCSAVQTDGFSNSALTFYLFDLNALMYNRPDDPPGTCYLSPYTNQNGTPVLGLLAVMAYRTQRFVADPSSTMGWFSVLAGGSAAMNTNSGYISFLIRYNPRPGDPTSFVFGDNITTLNNVFTLTNVGNANEPVSVNGVSGGVFAK